MDFFGSRDVERLAARRDLEGLRGLLAHEDRTTRLEAALALAEKYDEAGWRALLEAARLAAGPDARLELATWLVDRDEGRIVPILEEALKRSDGEAAAVFKDALETIEGERADAALRRAGYEPVLPHMAGNVQLVEYEGTYVRSVLPDTSQVEFLTAEQHHDLAVDLREAGMLERGLVETSLALWLEPEWAEAWFLRGVLFEELERAYEAWLCYRWALELDPNQADAAEALADIAAQHAFPPHEPDRLAVGLAALDWAERRDAAAGLGELGENATSEDVDRLVALFGDGVREVRHAAIEAAGNAGNHRAVPALLAVDDPAWLVRFAVIEALAQLGAVDELTAALRREMDRAQERNPVFSSQKDPLLEVEYERLLEIGVLAYEKTGRLADLLALAEGNAWVEVEEAPVEETLAWEAGDEEEPEEDEDLAAYVDEVALMASLALERLATRDLAGLDNATLQRLATVPDLTLLDVAGEEEAEPKIIHDLSAMRQAAEEELAKR
jgi:HEAT repeat protein